MANFAIQVATQHDASAIVSLANQYTYQNLTAADPQAGFLTGTFTEEMVQRMIRSAPCLVAYQQTNLAGFVINTNLPPQEYPPLVQEIIKMLPSLTVQNLPVTQYSYFFYGPVLVATSYRQQGLLRQMWLQTRKALQPHYKVGIAFIDQANQTSYRVHTKHLGFIAIGKIDLNNRTYNILAINLSQNP